MKSIFLIIKTIKKEIKFMGKNADFVSHKKSKQKNQDGSPKLPVASALVEGEIAINFAENVETLSIKNESGDVVTFSSDNYYTEKKLGSGFTGENSGVTVTDTILWVSGTGENAIVQKGGGNTASGKLSVAMGSGTTASGDYSVTEGRITTASGDYSHAEGYNTKANGISSHAEGASTTASGPQSHAEGGNTKANGQYSHAEGNSTSATSQSSHAEGNYTKANGQYSHAEGSGTVASGQSSHAEGGNTKANGQYSHAEGQSTSATSQSSHAEGSGTTANGTCSHSEGYNTTANGVFSHAEGDNTTANNQSEHASGQYNVSNSASTTFGDSGNTLFSVGNGTANNARHNAFEIRQNGDIYITSGSSDIKLQDYIGSPIDVDQVLDDTTSASTNPVSSKAVYKAATDNELVWTNAFVAMSGTVSAHTANTEIHVTAADKTAWVNKIGYAEYDSNDKKINFYKNDTDTATSICYIDATDFIKDGMVQNVEIKDVTSGGSQVTCLVISFNTDAGKQDINVPISDIFDASNYYTKSQTSGATEISNALNGLDARKLDASAYTPSVELWVRGTGLNSVVLKGSSSTASGNFSVAEGSQTQAIGNYSHAEGYFTTARGSDSHAEGCNTKANGYASHAEGSGTTASGERSHAEGYNTKASGYYSHAEGYDTTASNYSHAEGYNTKASGDYSHAEGYGTTASGERSHAEGRSTSATSYQAHAEGYYTKANGYASHAEGSGTTASGIYSHAEGNNTTANNQSEHASGQYNVSNSASTTFGDSGNTLFSVGNGTSSSARHNAFEIRQNGDIYITSGSSDIKLQDYIGGSVETVTAITPSNSGSTSPIATKVVAENELAVSAALNDLDARKLDASAYTPTDLSNYYTKSQTSGATEISNALNGLDTRKLDVSAYTPSVELWVSGTGLNSVVVKGSSGTASGNYSVAEGFKTIASGESSHAEGYGTKASFYYSHAEGSGTTASNNSSHAEGSNTKAMGESSHAEGYGTTASNSSSHAEGDNTTANGPYSHAEGSYTKANGSYSHAEGGNTITNNQSEHASGRYNVSSKASNTFGNSGNTLFSVGNGTDNNARHNAFEIRQNGDIYITSGGTTSSESIKLQDSIGSKADKSTTYTKSEIDDMIGDIETLLAAI